ncbi:MAG: NAD(P)H-dependent oxidoreductase [Casimicrobiaceae bacterium]|nr:NAD(P)H-dependent oxidoreductase [Casimicrobiaceae bacterium]
MKRLLIIHAGQPGGATAALVAAARDGAREAEPVLEVLVRSALVASAEDLLAADGYLFASPERFGYMAGELKLFFDRNFYRVMADHDPNVGGGEQSRIAGRPYALLVCAGSDGTGAAQAIGRIVTGWRLKPVAEPLIARRRGGMAGTLRGELEPQDLTRAAELGAALAMGLSLGLW